MSCNSVQEIARLFPSSLTVTSTFKITEALPICTTSSPNSTQMLLSTNSTTLNACSRLECTRRHQKLLSRSKIQNIRIRSSNSRPISNMNWKRWHTPNLWSHKCLPIQPKLSLPKAASYTKKRNLKKLRLSSRRLSTAQDTSATSHTILHSAITSWSS